MIKGFKEFLLRGNVIDLAVAVVIGAAFTGIVNALVKDILTPMIAAVGGQPDFAQLTFTVHGSKFRYGDFINSVINFVFVAAAIYFFVVVPVKRVTALRAQRAAAGQPVEAAAAPSDELITLREIRDALLARGDAAEAGPRP